MYLPSPGSQATSDFGQCSLHGVADFDTTTVRSTVFCREIYIQNRDEISLICHAPRMHALVRDATGGDIELDGGESTDEDDIEELPLRCAPCCAMPPVIIPCCRPRLFQSVRYAILPDFHAVDEASVFRLKASIRDSCTA